MSRSIATILLFACWTAAAAQDRQIPQQYSSWEREVVDGKVRYCCTYTFTPTTGGKTKTNLVVWCPTVEDIGYFYYTNGKDKYWCRAFNSQHQDYVKGKPKWNVIKNDKDKATLIADIPESAFGPPEHPICTGSDEGGVPGALMKEPPPPPVDDYRKYFESLQRKS